MKKLVVVLAVAFLLAYVGLSMAQVLDSRHDLSIGSAQTTDVSNTEQICVFCHTPHDSLITTSTTIKVNPLWNHVVDETPTTYSVYGGAGDPNPSPTLDSTPVDFDSDSGVSSALCLSCHDGTMAVNSVVNIPNDVVALTLGSGTEFTPAGLMMNTLSTDLTNDHPINMDYTAAGLPMQTNYFGGPPAVILNGLNPLPLYAGNTVQCGSCHDPHNEIFDASTGSFLRASMINSALCSLCHDDK